MLDKVCGVRLHIDEACNTTKPCQRKRFNCLKCLKYWLMISVNAKRSIRTRFILAAEILELKNMIHHFMSFCQGARGTLLKRYICGKRLLGLMYDYD